MAYIELDVDDALFEELQITADEEGISVEDLALDILRDEFSLPADQTDLDDDVDDDSDDYDEGLDFDGKD